MVLHALICRVIGARSSGCPITGVRLDLFVIGYPRHSPVNYVRFNGFHRNVSYSFQKFCKALQTFSLKRSSHRTFLISKFVIDFEFTGTVIP